MFEFLEPLPYIGFFIFDLSLILEYHEKLLVGGILKTKYTCGRMALAAFGINTYSCGRTGLAAFGINTYSCGRTGLAAFKTAWQYRFF